MKLFLKISAVVLLVGYLAVSLYLWGDNDRNRPCELFEITVADSTECNLLTRDDLRAYLAEAGLLPEGKPMRQVDTEQIERCVREIDLLCHVKCYHKRQGDVYLSVEQRRPVARVISDEGDNYYLDADGGRIAVDAMYLDYLPLVLGCDDDTLSARDLLPMISYISSHPFWNAQVEHIYISSSHEVSLIPRVGNHTILLGSPRDYEGKLSRVLALYEQVMPRIGWAAYDTISVKFDGQVVCTRKNKKYKHNSWSKI